jgi:hypothetical protein
LPVAWDFETMSGVLVSVLLWDFGNTLADERWMRRAPASFPGWSRAWSDVMAMLANDWDSGRIRDHVVFDAMAERTGMTIQDVERHVEHCCRSLMFNRAAWRVAAEHRLPQALVTVNPDLFIDRIVPEYRLEAIFDVIAVSCAEGTTNKVSLCLRALERLDFRDDRSGALLIDNQEDVVTAWKGVGGAAYWYRDDAAFESDLVDLIR